MNQNTKKKMTIPAEMAVLSQWVCWGAPGKARKCPYDPRSGYPAKAGQPNTWAPLTKALEAVEAGRFEGVGFEFNAGGIVGVDFDHCIKDGRLAPWAAAWVERLNSYTEISPSGSGLHVFCLGTLPGPAVKRPEAEMYDRARYFTVTGRPWGAVKPLREAQDAVAALYAELQKKAQQGRTEAPQATAAQTSPPGGADYLRTGLDRDGTFTALYRGDRPNGNESADDMALLNKLAYWCNRDPEAMRAAFLGSWHFQTKDEAHKKKAQRKDYLPRSIQRAIQDCARTAAEDNAEYMERRPGPGQGASGDVFGRTDYTGQPKQPPMAQLTKASDIPYEPPRWSIAPYFQRGKGTLIQGDNGSGKTAFMCAVVAHITTGRALLDSEIDTPGNVLMLSVEDDLPVLRGRIEADGGDLDKVYFMAKASEMSFTSPEVEQAIHDCNAVMVVFDPLQAFLGEKVDMFRANETRPKLAKLFEVCEREDCACAIVAHLAKSGVDKSPVNRALGSVDIPAAMRSILHLIRNPENEEECIMIHVKCSNAPKGRSISYTIGDRGGVHWNGYSDIGAEDLTRIAKRKEKGIPYEQEPLVQVFNQLITEKPGGGFWSYSDLKREGAKILGRPPYGDLNELRQKLDNGLARELMKRDGLLVTHGAKGRSKTRGVRIERYEVPQGYQTKIES